MRNILIIIFFIVYPITVKAQMPKVCGITFGRSYSFVEKELAKRYGEKANHNKDEIVYYDFAMGNFIFDSAHFCFQFGDMGINYFYLAYFSANFNLEEKKEAQDFREKLAKLLSTKYLERNTRIDNKGELYYLFGVNPRDDDTYLILLNLEKAQSKGGEWYYYVTLQYGPINFINPNADF